MKQEWSDIVDELEALRAERDALREALVILHEDILDYSVINNLSGHNNYPMRLARKALRLQEYYTPEEASTSIKRPASAQYSQTA